MKKIGKIFILATLSMLAVTGCSGNPAPYSDSIYVKKVENMPDNFVIGMDSSSVLSLEESGVKYYDFDGEEKDLFVILADNGVTHIRVRIWNDPWTAPDGNGVRHGYGGGNVDIDRAVTIGKRVTAAGMKLIPDFHYSDFWADPGRQTAPKAWKDKTLEEKQTLLYNYTLESMQKFKNNNVAVDYVQIGNETNNGLAGIENTDNYEAFSKLVTQGTRAVKAVYPEASTVVHFTNPNKRGYESIAAKLNRYGCEYDVFGSSYYPFMHGTLDNLQEQLQSIVDTFDKKVMIMETSYAYCDNDFDDGGNQFNSESSYDKPYPICPSGQINNFRNICDMMVNQISDKAGLGVCYWEGTWIPVGTTWDHNKPLWEEYGSGWAADYAAEYDEDVKKYGGGGTQVDNQCFFGPDGKALEQLKMFKALRTGNVIAEKIDGVVDSVEVRFMTNENIVLPDTVNAIYNSDRRDPVPVTWNIADPNSLKDNGPGIYPVEGTVSQNGTTYKTKCNVVLEVANYVKNGSFEDGNGNWTLTRNTSDTFQMLITDQNDNNPTDGKWTCHAYDTNNTGGINFELTQDLVIEKDLILNLSYYIIGGGNGSDVPPADQQDIYAYILEDGVRIAKVDGKLMGWSAGAKKYVSSSPITFTAGKTYQFGMHVETSVQKAWLDIDMINLYE